MRKSKLQATFSIAAVVCSALLASCSTDDASTPAMPAESRNSVGDPHNNYVVPENGDVNTAIDPRDIPIQGEFTATQGHFVATNPRDEYAPRFHGVIPAGWQTINVQRPPAGTVGVITPTNVNKNGYRPNVMIGASTINSGKKGSLKDGLELHSPPGAMWELQNSGKNKFGTPSELYRGQWSVRGVNIKGYGYVSEIDYGGQTYVFTTIMSADSTGTGIDKDRWEFQVNTILNSLDVYSPDVPK